MRLPPAAVLALAATAACGTPRRPPPERGEVVAERGTLGFVHEGDTTVIDEYTRTATALEGIVRPQVAGAKFGWARYRVEFGPSGEATRAVLELGRRGTRVETSAPGGTWTATVRDSEVVEVDMWGKARRVPVDAPTIPLFPPSIAMSDEVVRWAHRQRTAGGRKRLLIFPMASNASIWTVHAEWPAPDTVAIIYEGQRPLFYAVDPRGRVIGMRDGRNVVVRLR